MAEQINDVTHFSKKIIAITPGISALDLLSDNTDLSREKIKQAMTNGAVWLESGHGIQRIRRAKKTLTENDVLHIYYDENIQSTIHEQAELIADEKEYSIWNKPYGMYSQGSKWGDHCTIYRYAEKHLQPQRNAFIVHRLDRAANGLILLAHTKNMATKLSELFRDRKIVKRYKATVKGTTEFLIPLTINDEIDGKPARSTIISKQIDEHGDTVLTIEIESGRKHQIRKHLASTGHPVVGDRLYGSQDVAQNLQLQSYYLKFICPLSGTKKEYVLDD